MGLKPRKPEKKRFAKIKPLEDAVVKSKNTSADTKALDQATKELASATKALGTAMEKSHKAFDKAFTMIPDVAKTPSPAGPVPIPYPIISKLEKETKGAHKVTVKALQRHEKAQKKLVQVIDKQIKVLAPEVKKSAGDAAATTKGLVSAKLLGKAQWVTYSFDVKVEGKSVAQFFDLAKKNNKSAK